MSFSLSRKELLDGLPARRASTLLFAIESRTAHLVLQAKQVGARYLTERSAAEQEQHFLAALAHARANEKVANIHDLERYAAQWATLVPQEAGVCAAVAQMLGAKYRFRRDDVPALRRALRLEAADVQDAFQRFYGKPLTSIYQTELGGREQLGWRQLQFARRIDALPPIWTAFALTLSETVGAGILALPIAFAGLGVMSGIVMLVIFAVVNLLTIAAISESIVHNGNMRYGNNYFGRLVQDYFGVAGLSIMTLSLGVLNLLSLLAFTIGISTTMQSATTIPAFAWAVLLLAVTLYFLKRGSIEATAASALVIGVINLALILILIFVAAPHIRPDYLQVDLGGVGVQGTPIAVLGVAFGVVLTTFFGHTSAANAAKSVLRRDPSGAQLIRGNLLALGVAAVLYIVWTIAVNGAVPPGELAAATGTALEPMAHTLGPVVYVAGTIFVLLSMGMGCIFSALGLYYLVREWLPGPGTTPTVNRRRWLADGRVAFALCIAPTVLMFAVSLWLMWNNQQSFTDIIGFLGALIAPILCGIFPMLLLVASRRKADYPVRGAFAWLGHPVIVTLIYLVFLVGLVMQVWLLTAPVPRLLALVVALAMAALPFYLRRRGAFNPRRVIELKVETEPMEHAAYSVLAGGKATSGQVTMNYRSTSSASSAAEGVIQNYRALNSIQFELPSAAVPELKIWAHRVTPEGDSTPLPLQAEIGCDGTKQMFNVSEYPEGLIIATDDAPVRVELKTRSSVSERIKP